MNKMSKHSECTTILVGKKASIDGSTMIARNEDGEAPLNPKNFIVVNPSEQKQDYKAVISGVEIKLPANPLRYTATPDVSSKIGIWGESGINSANVAMSATETITSNSRILGIDPYVKGGIGEEDMLTIVLPYIKSAKEGVERLGALLEEFGTYEPNGIAFSDNEEIWWLETIGGHHWAAVRIPDDAYVVAPNRMNITDFDFEAPDTMCSSDLKELIDENHLNPDYDGYNLRHIFGSATVKDNQYNNPRAWYIQRFFTPEVEQSPFDQNLSFICKANRLISIEDVKWALSSHYEETVYDCYGDGTDAQKRQLRPVGINRNQEVHILQLRNDVAKEIAGIHWLAFGPNTFNTVVPFYANVTDTPAFYKEVSEEFGLDNMYWLSGLIAVLGDTNYNLYSDVRDDYVQASVAAFRQIQRQSDQAASSQTDLSHYLASVNEEYAKVAKEMTTKLLGQMVMLGAPQMKLRFNLGD
ncbi:C69 family dipeptidase [Enterococcus canintestini]|uniref:Dipeptidase n=1 Tax=Enterococcus canintestini TaxID=317010 RepID=A0A267HP75_9ENTE|nr:C69 family dipeptidase [Enterococcus canintestini]PAB00161.1 peptidase U34 [Enterococcus canintestini]